MKYKQSLDGLRAVAISVVVSYHTAANLFPGGWSGVDIFFVLSGFLIASILLSELRLTGHISLIIFHTRRLLRLTPAIAFLLLFEIVRSMFTKNGSEIREAALVVAAYFMNWSRAFDLFPQDVLGHTWSLSIEEQFYILWPAILLFIYPRKPVRWVSFAICAVFAWRLYLVSIGVGVERVYNGFDTHCDAILIGCLLSLLGVDACRERIGKLAVGYGRHLLKPTIPVLLLASTILSLRHDSLVSSTFGNTIVAASTAWVILTLYDENWLDRVLCLPPVVYTGRISYGWYLWHHPVLMLGNQIRFSGLVQHVYVIGLIGLSYLIAAFSYEFIERPFLTLKTRFETTPRESPSRVEGSPALT